ncbi:MAG: hypothetical protein IMZ53_12880 [Thermoplasmata archaeon]|nr:hypothetical protein [Thermoplasmata archaeon]
MSNEDIERIGEIMDKKLNEHLSPIHLRCERHTQTLYGHDGQGGVVGDVKEAKKRIGTFITLSSMLQGGLAVAIAFKEKIFN